QSSGIPGYTAAAAAAYSSDPIEDPGYEVVKPTSSSSHNYERINRASNGSNGKKFSMHSTNGLNSKNRMMSNNSDDDCQADPGYEVVRSYGSDSRAELNRSNDDEDSPCYETIQKPQSV